MPYRLILILSLSFALPARATETSWGHPFGSHMVLPMLQPIPVWGKAPPHRKLTLRFAATTIATQANAEGDWFATLPPLHPSTTPRSLELDHPGGTLTCTDVLVGRLWCFTGQSNMDFPLQQAIGGKEALRQAPSFTTIRYRNLTTLTTQARPWSADEAAQARSTQPFQGSWQNPSLTPPASLSAIAWWTATEATRLEPTTPIGIIEHAVGGSGTESWIPRATLQSLPSTRTLLADTWLTDSHLSAWARQRARLNLNAHPHTPHPFQPSFNFENAVAPWRHFPLDAVIWYQGETNAEIADQTWNFQLLQTLITGWRHQLQQPKLPFYLIELPRIQSTDPLRAHWPAYRQVQKKAARSLPFTHLIPTTDLGEETPEIHPPDKFPIAQRLAPLLLHPPTTR